MSKDIYYVYEHWRPDKDACFYVGKGKYSKRAFDIKNRSRWHKAVTSKLTFLGLCLDVRMFAKQLSEKEAFMLERERIVYWRSLGVVLVNMTDGGEGVSGNKVSEETRERMRAAATLRNKDPKYLEKLRVATTANWHADGYRERVVPLIVKGHEANKGKPRAPCSEETRQKISRSNKGRSQPPMSAETREKIGASQRGKVISEDVRQKISVANTGKKRTDEAKEKLRKLAMQNIETFRKNAHLGPISLSKKVICLDDGTVFESASAAARAYGLKKATSISDVCSGKPSRTRAAGRRFKYLEAA